MVRICSITAAVLLLMTTWVGAGTLQVLSDSRAVGPVTPLYVQPGMVVKAEFKTQHTAGSDMRTESDALLPESTSVPSVKPTPAAAFKQRRAEATPSAMQPPARRPVGTTNVAEAGADPNDLELDLEKDLVISPPPPKTESGSSTRPSVETRGVGVQEAIEAAKPKPRKKTRTTVKRPVRRGNRHLVSTTRSVRKVRPPMTSYNYNPWSIPAGTYQVQRPAIGYSRRAPETHARVTMPPKARTFVRDGVTVKLAPQPMPAAYHNQEYYASNSSDVLSAAMDVLGMPFAFISSFF